MKRGKYLAAGLALAALIAGILVLINIVSRPRLEGSIMQLRTVATDSRAIVVLLDARITNPGRTLFMVRDVVVVVEDAGGVPLEADAAAEPDIDRLLGYYKMAGPRYNPVLKSRERIAPGETKDYTIAGAFALTGEELAARRSLRIRLTDVDGAVSEILLARK